MTDRELMQQTLDALVRMHSYGDVFRYQEWQANPYEQVSEAITAIRERLAHPEQEPVAWFEQGETGEWFLAYSCNPRANTKPLYTSPPQRKPLTDSYQHRLINEFFYEGMQPSFSHYRNFARAIERAHGIGEKE